MRTKYKYIHFVESFKQQGESEYECFAIRTVLQKEHLLGIVCWYPPFQCYRFIPESFIFLTSSRSNDIAHFMGQLEPQG